MKNEYDLQAPEDTARMLAGKIKTLRLGNKWKQSTLARRSGVSLASLKRFEQTGLVSLQNLLKLAFALERLGDFEPLLQPPTARSIAELESTQTSRKTKRGTE